MCFLTASLSVMCYSLCYTFPPCFIFFYELSGTFGLYLASISWVSICQMIWRVWLDYWAVDQKNLTFLVLIPCQVNPQFYAFRWITLLLTQEFNFADILHIWDVILSDPEGPQVQFCSYLSCTTLNFSLKKKKLMDWHLTLSSTTT